RRRWYQAIRVRRGILAFCVCAGSDWSTIGSPKGLGGNACRRSRRKDADGELGRIMTVVFYILLLLTEHHGQVIFNGVPVPGATVTATQGEKKFVAVTDQQGAYSFPELADGPFTVQVEMLGFSTLKQEVNAPAAEFELKMLPIEDIQAEIAHGTPADPPPTPAPAAATPSPNKKQGQENQRKAANQPRQQTGVQRTEVNASNANSTTPSNDPPAPPQSSAFANLSQEELNH